MFIQTQLTPNPLSIKFIPGVEVLGSTPPMHFSHPSEATCSPLAVLLFENPDIQEVFLGADFITVTKSQTSQWDLLKPDILTRIMEHFVAQHPVLLSQATGMPASATQPLQEETPTILHIKEVLDTYVRPAVAQDGGDIIFQRFEEGVVYLMLRGACSGCPSSTMTLKHGVENMLKYYVPEVEAVEAI